MTIKHPSPLVEGPYATYNLPTTSISLAILHTSRQPLQKHPSGWVTPWSAKKVLDGYHQRVDISIHARTAHNVLLQKRLEEDL